jgi:hypothetical protein
MFTVYRPRATVLGGMLLVFLRATACLSLRWLSTG